jgi:hypothetical protein
MARTHYYRPHKTTINMTRPIITTLLLVALTLFVGCSKKERGPAYGQQQEFRRQIANSVPVKEWGYSISDVRVSDDAQKVLVIFASSGGTNYTELVMVNDGFRRYTGTFSSAERIAAAIAAFESDSTAWSSNRLAGARAGLDSTKRPTSPMRAGSTRIVVTLPDR